MLRRNQGQVCKTVDLGGGLSYGEPAGAAHAAPVSESLPGGLAWRRWLGVLAVAAPIVVLVHAAIAADAPRPALKQWRGIHKSLFDLVTDGYQIVSVTNQSDDA